MIEKSLKQREQLEGYLREVVQSALKGTEPDFLTVGDILNRIVEESEKEEDE